MIFHRPLFLFIFLIVFSIVLPSIFAAETITVTKALNNKEIKVRVGATIRLQLEELGAAGYSWKVKNLDGDYFDLLKIENAASPEADDITGAPVTKTWLFRAKKAGRSDLRLLHYRLWEGEESASETFVLMVRIIS